MYSKAHDLFKGDRQEKHILFCITEDDIQIVAQRKLKRKLTDDEMQYLSKDIEETFSEGMMTKIETAITLNISDIGETYSGNNTKQS